MMQNAVMHSPSRCSLIFSGFAGLFPLAGALADTYAIATGCRRADPIRFCAPVVRSSFIAARNNGTRLCTGSTSRSSGRGEREGGGGSVYSRDQFLRVARDSVLIINPPRSGGTAEQTRRDAHSCVRRREDVYFSAENHYVYHL